MLLQFQQLDPYGELSCVDRLLIAGDFNFNIKSSQATTHRPWVDFLNAYFQNVITDLRDLHTPTFRRGSATRSVIDYIMVSNTLSANYLNAGVDFINPKWSDHAALSVDMKLDNADSYGPGIWRANPIYLVHKDYRRGLAHMLSELYRSEIAHSNLSSQLTRLHKKRHRILQSSLPEGVLVEHLPRVERQIASLQRDLVQIAALKAEKVWGERGETDAGFLKKSASTRVAQRSILQLWDPSDAQLYSSKDDLLRISSAFYQQLFSAEPINEIAIDNMISHIPSDCTLSAADRALLSAPITMDDILQQSARAPKQSSPGLDGLSYGFLRLIFKHPDYSRLVIQVYNDALTHSLFPASWIQTSVCLLPKKGDLRHLSNWRPITLINCDAKVFTRLMNGRLNEVISSLISPFQTGFMKGRFIPDNGLLTQIAMEQASFRSSHEVGLLCDQEKAYDRVHPTYLRSVLLAFGLPESFVSTICTLFFSTTMKVNVNGHSSSPVSLGRGLRQGDPISPLLFNLVIEPLVKSIAYSPRVHGFCFPPVADSIVILWYLEMA
ncbi:hypothetical protein G6F43_012387 [Rhizopus delemar]|nr:hypothetical protein G6F43_012387 [Rhizopus delemar]